MTKKNHDKKPDIKSIENVETITQAIRDLRKEVEERMIAIENGRYYEENDGECMSKEQKQKLQVLFQQTEALFLSKQLQAAKAAYEELFEFELEYLSIGIELRQTRARYFRCIYEQSTPKQRVEKLLEIIAANNSIKISKSIFDGNYPFLQDIIDTHPDDLPEFDKFLPKWEKALSKIEAQRAILLHLEAIEFIKGISGIAKLAQSKQQPLYYLYWIEKLIAKKAWAELISVTQKALEVLPHSDNRASIADSLILAATNQKDLPRVLKGKQEKFLSHPDDNTLLDWINEAELQENRTEALKQASKFLYKKRELSTLYIKVSLMAGEIDKAFVRVSKVKAYGWTGEQNSTGIVFAAILIALLPRKQQITELHKAILEYYSRSYSSETSLVTQIIKGIRQRPASQRNLWQEWAENIGKQRIEHIVSNKYRKAYKRAAEILGGLGEYFILNDKADYGISIIVEYRDVKFSRYPAFKKEINSVIKNSAVLRDKGTGY